VAAFDDIVTSTLGHPFIGSLVPSTPTALGVRRRLLRRFNFEVAYLADGETLVILAVFHGKRRPGYWHERLASLRRGDE
jgi:plasmid stabilization system protein ParE